MATELASPQTHTGVDGKGILITAAAMKQLAALMQQQGGDQVLRVGVRSGGCSGPAGQWSGARVVAGLEPERVGLWAGTHLTEPR